MDKNVTEMNILMAEFMGAKFTNDDPENFPNGYYYHEDLPELLPSHFAFHESYDWLMPVWVKFRDLKIPLTCGNIFDFKVHKKIISESIINCKISEAHKHLHDAIVWWNTIKK